MKLVFAKITFVSAVLLTVVALSISSYVSWSETASDRFFYHHCKRENSSGDFDVQIKCKASKFKDNNRPISCKYNLD